MPSPVARRSVLGGLTGAAIGLAGALSLSACSGDSDPGPTTAPPTPGGPDDPDAAVRAQAVQSEAMLIALYDATVRRHPDIAGQLREYRAQHLAHQAAVQGAGPTPKPTTAATVPAQRAAAVRALRAAETAAAAARQRSCVAATDDSLAATFAWIGASEAQHAAAWATGATTGDDGATAVAGTS